MVLPQDKTPRLESNLICEVTSQSDSTVWFSLHGSGKSKPKRQTWCDLKHLLFIFYLCNQPHVLDQCSTLKYVSVYNWTLQNAETVKGVQTFYSTMCVLNKPDKLGQNVVPTWSNRWRQTEVWLCRLKACDRMTYSNLESCFCKASQPITDRIWAKGMTKALQSIHLGWLVGQKQKLLSQILYYTELLRQNVKLTLIN